MRFLRGTQGGGNAEWLLIAGVVLVSLVVTVACAAMGATTGGW